MVLYTAKARFWSPLSVFAAAALLFVLITIIYRFWRASGRIPMALVAVTVCVAGSAGVLLLRRPSVSVIVYSDRIVTAHEVIPLGAVTSVRLQAESSIGYIAGRPAPAVRRTLIVETSSGPKTIATDDRYDDLDQLQAAIETGRSALR